MMSKNKSLDLINYINTPMSKESIAILYLSNDIKYEKCELFRDFVLSLINLVFDTYMGDDITNSIEQINHFKWCWNKNIENFKKEGIVIGDKKSYNYFLEFMTEVYYPNKQKEENSNIRFNINKLWSFIFDYNNIKSRSDVDTLVEVYKMFENSIKNQE
jgi:hypothetical protein